MNKLYSAYDDAHATAGTIHIPTEGVDEAAAKTTAPPRKTSVVVAAVVAVVAFSHHADVVAARLAKNLESGHGGESHKFG